MKLNRSYPTFQTNRHWTPKSVHRFREKTQKEIAQRKIVLSIRQEALRENIQRNPTAFRCDPRQDQPTGISVLN